MASGNTTPRRDRGALPARAALMVLVGERNWYMPRRLDRWVPHISIEGGEFFHKREEPEPVIEPDAAAPA
jgi:putative drug exporter of the RND superfamily